MKNNHLTNFYNVAHFVLMRLTKKTNNMKSKDKLIHTKVYGWFALLLAFVSSASAQNLLTLSDALKMALENNYAIQVAKNDAEITKNNNRLGAAGMLPSVVGTLNQDNQTQDSKQKFLNGSENNRNGAQNSNFNANVELGWTIFDGLKMFAVKSRLEELQRVGELRMRANIEQTFVRVTKAYYDVLLAKQQLLSTQKSLDNSKNRLQLADEKYKAGKSPRTELLKAQVDVNTDQAAFMRQQNALNNAKANLNQLLARDLNTPFDVQANNPVNNTYKLDELMNKVNAQNVNLLVAKKNQQISLLSTREIRAERMPTIQFRSGYNYAKQTSQAGFLQSSQTNGFHYGAGVSINLFNGFDVSKRLQNAQLTLKSNELIYRDSFTRIQNQVQQAYNNYVLSTQLVAFEKQNVGVAQENFDIANEQYKVGVITSIELRDAQLNVLNSELRLFTAEYEAKLNETELLRLCGELMKL